MGLTWQCKGYQSLERTVWYNSYNVQDTSLPLPTKNKRRYGNTNNNYPKIRHINLIYSRQRGENYKKLLMSKYNTRND